MPADDVAANAAATSVRIMSLTAGEFIDDHPVRSHGDLLREVRHQEVPHRHPALTGFATYHHDAGSGIDHSPVAVRRYSESDEI